MKVSRFEGHRLNTYEFVTLDELQAQIEIWKAKFREDNGTDRILKLGSRDRSYEMFCEENQELIEKFLGGI